MATRQKKAFGCDVVTAAIALRKEVRAFGHVNCIKERKNARQEVNLFFHGRQKMLDWIVDQENRSEKIRIGGLAAYHTSPEKWKWGHLA